MRTGGWCGDFAGEARVTEPEQKSAGPGGPTILTFKGGRFEMGYPLGMPTGVDGTIGFQVYVDGELAEATGKPVAVLTLESGVQHHLEVLGVATHLRQNGQANVLNHAGGRRVRLRWAASTSEDTAGYRIYGNGGAGAVDYTEAMDEVEATAGGVRPTEVEWRSGELADGIWRFGVRAMDEAGNEAASPTRETGEIEVRGLPRAVAEVTAEYDEERGAAEIRWAGSSSFN